MEPMNDRDNCRHNFEHNDERCGMCEPVGSDLYPGWEEEETEPVAAPVIETLPDYLKRTGRADAEPTKDAMTDEIEKSGKCCMCDQPRGESKSPVACEDCWEYAVDRTYGLNTSESHRLLMEFSEAKVALESECCTIHPWSAPLIRKQNAELAIVEYWEKHREGGR